MSKRKFKKGSPITSLDQLFQYDYFIWNSLTRHAGFILSLQVRVVQEAIRRGVLFAAERLTNEEYYAGKTDDQLAEMRGEGVCNYCRIPEEHRGARSYGGEPYFCSDTGECERALEAWKGEYVE